MRVAALAALAALALAGCGGGTGGGHTVRIAAASSLTGALDACSGSIHDVAAQVEFGGSGELAAQIRQGVGIDVFAAADMRLPRALAAAGRAEPPVPFATNQLVLAVPRGRSSLHRLSDLASAPGTSLAVGAASVPVGDYTREVLDRLPAAQRAAVAGEIRSEEPDVKSIVGKLLTGAVDAGFVYRTDALAAGGRLTAIRLPAALRPTVVYGVSVVRRSAAAERVVASLLHGGCALALRRAGFGAPPA